MEKNLHLLLFHILCKKTKKLYYCILCFGNLSSIYFVVFKLSYIYSYL